MSAETDNTRATFGNCYGRISVCRILGQGLNRFAVLGAPNPMQCLIEGIETAVLFP